MLSRLVRKFKGTSENNRIVIVNVIGAFGVKGLAMIVSLFTMPAYIRFFGDEKALGLWFTMVSVLNWILNFDLGIGNGLRNHLASAVATNDKENAKKYLSSAYIAVGAICLILSAVLFVVFGFVNWNFVFNIKEDIVSAEALLLSVRIVFIGIILQMFVRLISSVLYAIQKSSATNLLQLCVTVLTLLCVLLIPGKSNDENMVTMAFVHCVACITPSLVATIIVFSGKKMRGMIPAFSAFSMSHAKAVLSLGGVFLIVQIAYMVIMNTNEYLITFLSGNENVVDYQVYNRLFALGSTVFSLALTPIWSAVTKATAEKNMAWVKSLYKKLVLLGLVFCVLEFLLVTVLQFVVNIWLGENAITVDVMYALVFAMMGSTMIMSSVLASIANGLGLLKPQLICYTIGAVAKPFVAWGLVSLTGSWIGVIIANVISVSLYCVVQPILFHKYFRKEENKNVSI